MDLGLKGKVALVTAASGGLGIVIARELAAEGARVVIAGRDPEKTAAAEKVLADETGGEVCGILADCTRAEDIDRLVAEVERRFEGIDVLINNSGGPPSKPFEQLSDEDWHAVFDAKFLPQVRCARAAFPGMQCRRGGRIITLIGSHGRTPHAYAITAGVVNAALLNLTKALAELGAPHGVLVNAINPGPIDTDRMRYLVGQQAEKLGIGVEESRKIITRDILLNRFGTPEEIAAVAAFLASKRASFITGAMFDVDGGYTRAI